ncbi:PhzF family phenazine biosynthesis protein [Streptomonospora salina]|uniref:Trans-2,3-dihydro-3-hydroxyanthranilate isomerase n=1 Tax=Streptomonospora salina TaxID=104205 RepID=A0A841EI26_9ACTN|nr:PhzF family phenazine biosynthesis protein [Streptomonospora salina]MBB6000020.1 trans-2,3-dihydro-3-hydroxyanthranilate isomerase [Streptomonospora salina]
MHKYTLVDAFSRAPLEGNPVAVFFKCSDLSTDTMQLIAREMNLSETTFVLPAEGEADARIRIFTPVNELPFAGHPMLGTAIALSEALEKDDLRVETQMGVVPSRLTYADGSRFVLMRHPIPTWEPYEYAAEVCVALGVEASAIPVDIYHNGPRHVFVGLDSVAALSHLDPDHRALAAFEDVAINCFAGEGDEWRTRMFSPAYGVVEDAATGSAAGPLAIHLARHGLARFGQEIRIVQGVEVGRPSPMWAAAYGNAQSLEEVHVGGYGVVAGRGELHA